MSDQDPVAIQMQALRKRFDMTQEEFGDAVGVNGRTVSTWETGAHLPTKSTQRVIESLCGWPAGSFATSVKTGRPFPPCLVSGEGVAHPDAEADTLQQVLRLLDENTAQLARQESQLADVTRRLAALEVRGPSQVSTRGQTRRRAQSE